VNDDKFEIAAKDADGEPMVVPVEQIQAVQETADKLRLASINTRAPANGR